MDNTLVANHGASSTSDRARKKRKKKSPATASAGANGDGEGYRRWRSEKQQRIYLAKLVRALNRLRIGPETPRRNRAVREAADRALATAARGRTLWSRAILKKPIKLKFRKQKKKKKVAGPASTSTVVTGAGRSIVKPRVSVRRLKGKSLPAVNRKVRVLSRLVPGCHKQPVPVILEEATDYIAALEMQIRAMTAITELLSGSTTSAPSQQN